MTRIHFTLTTWFNVLIIVICALVVGVLLTVMHPRPFLLSGIGAGAGLLAGMLQRQSVRSSPATFAEARSALQVRRAFRSNHAGTLSIATMWVTGVALIAVAFAQGGHPLSPIAGYASFMLMRDIVAFGAIGDMRRNASSLR